MLKQILFAIAVLITIGVFTWTIQKYFKYFKFTKKKPLGHFGERIWVTFKVAFLQDKILRKPLIGLMHAIVWWGFIVILIGSIEMVIDGLFGTERCLSFLGPVYDFIMASGDIFALLIAVIILGFLIRRLFMHVNRFYGPEMKPISKMDANFALIMIFLLMITLTGMNVDYLLWTQATGEVVHGVYPVSNFIAKSFVGTSGEPKPLPILTL